MIRPILPILIATACVMSGLRAQRGIVSVIPTGLIFSDGGGPSPGALQFREPGEMANVEAFSSSPVGLAPVYTLSKMFRTVASDVTIDAMSTGNDILPLDPFGHVCACGNWVILNYSVTSGSLGAVDSHIESTLGSTYGPGAEIMGHYVNLSDPTPSFMWENVYLEHSGKDLEQPGALDIGSYDAFMALIVNGGGASGPFFKNTSSFYFSVSEVSATALHGATHGRGPFSSIPNSRLHGNTVMRMEWDANGGVNGTWSDAEFVEELWGVHGEGGEIDALAVWERKDAMGVPYASTIIFSTVKDTVGLVPQNQMWLWRDSTNAVQELRLSDETLTSPPTSAGKPLTPGLDIRDTDDIDAFCVVDPEPGTLSGNLGTASAAPQGGQLTLGVGRNVIDYRNGVEEFVVHTSGWPNGVPEDGDIAISVTVDPAFGPIWLDQHFRLDSEEDLVEWRFRIDSTLAMYFPTLTFQSVFLPYAAGAVPHWSILSTIKH